MDANTESLVDPLERLSHEELHPLLQPAKLTISTPMMDGLCQRVSRWVHAGIPGAAIVGNPRIGKTTAVESIQSSFKTRTGEPIPGFLVNIAPRDRKTIAGIYKNICYAVGQEPKKTATADDMAAHLVYFFGDQAASNSSRNVLLFVDEFQRLEVSQLSAFSELFDKCSLTNTTLTTVFVGNLAESQSLLNTLENSRYQHIKGRFFCHLAEYSGIRTANELKKCLIAFENTILKGIGDVDSALGKDISGPFRSGWHLTDIHAQIWDTYTENFQKPLRLDSWAMQYFTSAMGIMILDYLPKYGHKEDVDSIIYESIKASGLVPSVITMH